MKAKTKDEPALFEQPPEVESPAKAKRQQVAKTTPAPAPSALEMIAAAAANPNIDPAKARELFKLYYETEAKKEFHEALLAIDLPAINRDGKIPVAGGKFLRFASFENVHKAVMPLLKEHQFRMSFQPMPGPNGEGMVVECKLIRGLYEEKCVVPISIAPASRAMNSQQAIGAAIKYASRYGVMYLLNLRSEAPEDLDTDGVAPDELKKITGPQAKQLLKAIDESTIEATRFMEKYGITAAHELPAKMFDEAMKALKDYGEKAKAARQ